MSYTRIIRDIRLTAAAVLLVIPSTIGAQTADRTNTGTQTGAFADQKLEGIVERIEAHADAFEESFEAALDKSTLNGSNLEDRLNQWADLVEDELDNMAENYNERDADKCIEHLENAMVAGTGINRAMLRQDIAKMAEAQWKVLRHDMNVVATAFRRPVLANMTVVTLVPAKEILSKAEVKHVMERLEASTDRFEEKFDKAMNARVVTKTNREEIFTRWTDDLEDVTDELLEKYKEQDSQEFSNQLQNTFVIAAALNRVVLRSDLTPDVATEWDSIRKDLNTLAQVFGHAVLPDKIVTVAQTGR